MVTNMRLHDKRIDPLEKSVKYLWQIRDSKYVESVAFPAEGGYGTCVSTQFGCGMGCLFCATAALGMQGNLSGEEIFMQAAATAAQFEQDISSGAWRFVTLAGMGEPLANIASSLASIRLLLDAGVPLVSLSTIGFIGPLQRLADEHLDFRVYLSLHACTEELRSHLIPASKDTSLSALIDAMAHFAERRPLGYGQISYLLLRDINSSDYQLQKMIALISGRPLVVQLLMCNEIPGSLFARCPDATAEMWRSSLEAAGIKSYVMPSAARRIQGGCGQLAATANAENKRRH
jgi:23S rRNA (adenine2503-C2)-methyltransferase